MKTSMLSPKLAGMNERVVVVVPIYQPELSALEHFGLSHSLRLLRGRVVVFAAPQGLKLDYYRAHFPGVPVELFEAQCFASIPDYNRTLLSPAFYGHFSAFEFVLVLQTDAVLLRDELDAWTSAPFDYVGAPWPQGHELKLNLGAFEGDHAKRLKVHVGNGGLSLRRVPACLALLDEFALAAQVFRHSGSSEDLFFAFMGEVSKQLLLPSEMRAACFALELSPRSYVHWNQGQLPMGGHAWAKHDPAFWREHLPDDPLWAPLLAAHAARLQSAERATASLAA